MADGEQEDVPKPRLPGVFGMAWALNWALLLPIAISLALFTAAAESEFHAPPGTIQHALFLLVTFLCGIWPIACVVGPPVAFYLWRYRSSKAGWCLMTGLLLYPLLVGTLIWIGTRLEAGGL